MLRKKHFAGVLLALTLSTGVAGAAQASVLDIVEDPITTVTDTVDATVGDGTVTDVVDTTVETTTVIVDDAVDTTVTGTVEETVVYVEETVVEPVVETVVIEESKARIRSEASNIFLSPSGVVIHADDLVPLPEKTFAEMRADKAGAAGNQIPSHRFFL